MRVLGIDPGYNRLGIAVVEKTRGSDTLLCSCCFEQPKETDFAKRLVALGNELARIVTAHAPDVLAIEKTFFGKNQKTAILVSEARGVVLYIAGTHNLTIHEYTPQEIKVAITGHGTSDKKQMARMLHNLIPITKKISHDDEYDAIAIALTYLASNKEAAFSTTTRRTS